ncbi:Universal stress protein A-like protein [Ananas comosus]|uniref:Universal stress protein A-like protein n=1 Tax=Ananas comosus TaxID=4615 RepID=A0A199URT2_ANACO|nr:Universal stress protein A-like protein [Ananas comosus]
MATAAEAAAAAEAEGVAAAEAAAAEETTKRRTVMVVGIEDSEHSYYALGWTLRRFFGGGAAASGIDLVIVHAKPSPANVVNLAGPGNHFDLIRGSGCVAFVESDLRAIAAGVVAKARELCATNSVSALVEVVEGDARYVLCEAVEKHQADILVVGSHGYGAIKRAVLGSVSDYCAHHAHCTVMIVKKPKSKH